VQGVGAALTVPTAVAVLAGAFTEERSRARAFGIFSAAAATGFTAGLVFGGLITSGLSWRWIFLLKVPAVALTLVAAVFGLREPPRQRARGSYDFAGAVTATAGATLLTYGITRAGAPGADPLLDVAAPLAGSAAFLGLFAIIERHAATPLLPLRLVRRRATAVANAAALTVLAAPFAISYLVTLYMQGVLHQPPWRVAVALLPGSIASALVSRYLAPFLLHRYGLRRVYAVALGFVAVGAGILIGLTEATATWLIVLATLISFGLGMGLAYPAATFGGVHGVDAGDQGAAGGLNNTALQIGGGIGLAIVASVITTGLGGSPPDQVPSDVGLQAARWGAVAAAALPLLGAMVVAIGLRDRNGADDHASDRGRPAS
jgi:MFS family permease